MTGRLGTDLTYPEVGATAGELPAGYRIIRRSRHVGSGAELFHRLGNQVLEWQLQRRSGVHVPRRTPPAAAGVEVVLGVGLGPFRIQAPARVVYVVEEPGVRGFAYGTLPGHPECGEERFVVRREGEFVLVEITAFSRPATRLMRAAGPLGRLGQDVLIERYLCALGPS
ncbi:MAG: DUF1990 family protein [Propionibacteriaceae bacterium]